MVVHTRNPSTKEVNSLVYQARHCQTNNKTPQNTVSSCSLSRRDRGEAM
jgi:hypothetical protein